MSDVYSFGVVLLELLTGRRSVDKNRCPREQNLVEWARPMLNDARKLGRIMDPRLEGQYSETGARKAAALAYQCLSHRPKQRPRMSDVVKTLEPLQDYEDVLVGPFVYTVPTRSDKPKQDKDSVTKECEPKEEKCHHHENHKHHHRHHRHQTRSPRMLERDALKRNHRNGLNSPLHCEVREAA